MSWQLFAVVQITAFALAAIAALVFRNASLRRSNDELMELCTTAEQALASLSGKLAAIESMAPPEKLLKERVKALSGDDPVSVVRRLVLENEVAPKGNFAERLTEHLASQQPERDEEEFIRRWRAAREECQQLAMFLVADNPDCHQALVQIFEVLEPLERSYGIELEPLEPPREAPPAPDTELTQAELDALLAGTQSGAGDSPNGAGPNPA